MRKLFKRIVAVITAVSLISIPVYADDIDKLTQERQEAEQHADDIANLKQLAEDEKQALQDQLNELFTKMAELEQQLIATGQQIQQAEYDLAEAQVKERAQYVAMKLRIKFMYESGNASLFSAIISSENLSDVLNKVEYAKEISKYDRRMISVFIETQNEIAQIKLDLEKKQAELEKIQAEYIAQQTELDALIVEKSAEVAGFEEQLQEAMAVAAEASRREQAAIEAKAAAEEAARQRQQQQQQAQISGGDSGGGSSYIGYNPGTGNVIVDTAYTQLGVDYVWGGETPGVALDCSGLVQYCYRCAGISIPRTSAEMAAQGSVVSDPQPGDICWTPGHVAIYIGDGMMIEAQQSGVPVCVSPVRVSKYLRF